MPSNSTVAARRLASQAIAKPIHRDAAGLVSWMGAVQAQAYPAAKWALGLRLPPATTDTTIAAAVDRGEIVRTHVLRPTWHFVARQDADWMIGLTAPRVHRRMTSAHRSFALDSAVLVKAARIMERALRDEDHLTRGELGAHLTRASLPAGGIALGLLTMYAELERVMCSGAFRGKELTYARYDTRVTAGRRLAGEEAIAELAKRYFQSHGPATIRDFVWWSSLTTADARRGLESNGGKPLIVDGVTYWTIGDTPKPPQLQRSSVHLLPIYDEYVVAYRDRVAVPLGRTSSARLDPAVVIDGQVVGTWKVNKRAAGIDVRVTPGRSLSKQEQAAIRDVVKRYGRFLKTPASLSTGWRLSLRP